MMNGFVEVGLVVVVDYTIVVVFVLKGILCCIVGLLHTYIKYMLTLGSDRPAIASIVILAYSKCSQDYNARI